MSETYIFHTRACYELEQTFCFCKACKQRKTERNNSSKTEVILCFSVLQFLCSLLNKVKTVQSSGVMVGREREGGAVILKAGKGPIRAEGIGTGDQAGTVRRCKPWSGPFKPGAISPPRRCWPSVGTLVAVTTGRVVGGGLCMTDICFTHVLSNIL